MLYIVWFSAFSSEPGSGCNLWLGLHPFFSVLVFFFWDPNSFQMFPVWSFFFPRLSLFDILFLEAAGYEPVPNQRFTERISLKTFNVQLWEKGLAFIRFLPWLMQTYTLFSLFLFSIFTLTLLNIDPWQRFPP